MGWMDQSEISTNENRIKESLTFWIGSDIMNQVERLLNRERIKWKSEVQETNIY